MQFIPVIERVNEDGRSLYQEGTTVSERSVTPEQFGHSLTTTFDEWVRHDVGRVFVQTFEATLRNWLRLPSSGMCVFEPTCGLGLALEHNGDLYSCDHFVEPKYLLGNIQQEHMSDLVASDQQQKFGRDKLDTLPRTCRDCDVRFACHGECPKNRFCEAPRSPQGGVGTTAPEGLSPHGGEPGLNYLCAGYKAFFHHVDRPMQTMALLMRQGRPATQVMQILAEEDARLEAVFASAGRNDPCPCGSGLKFKQCHGREQGGANEMNQESAKRSKRRSRSRAEADTKT